MESVYQIFCLYYTVWLGISRYIDQSISQLLAFYSHGDTDLLVCQYHETILVTVYRAWIKIKGL